MEQESSDQAILSADSLSQLISYYGNTVPNLLNEYLQSSLKSFSEGQKQLCRQYNADSMKVFEKMSRDNLEMWHTVRDDFLRLGTFEPPLTDKKPK